MKRTLIDLALSAVGFTLIGHYAGFGMMFAVALVSYGIRVNR